MFVECRGDHFTPISDGLSMVFTKLIVSENSLVKYVVNSSAWISSKFYANSNMCLFVSQIVSGYFMFWYIAGILLFNIYLLVILSVVAWDEVLQ